MLVLACALGLDARPARAQNADAGASDPDALGFAETGPASSEPAGDDELGFSEASGEEGASDDAAPSSAFGIAGFLRSVGGLWVERMRDNPFATARQTVHLALTGRKDFTLAGAPAALRLDAAGEAAYDLAYRHERARYDAPTLEAYETDLIARRLEVALSLGAFELSVGRQVVNWGQGEVLQVLDLINPRDLREPALTPATEMRLSTLMTRVGVSFAPHRVELIAVHESFFGYFPPPLATFSPLRELLLETPALARALDGKDLRYRHLPGHALVDPDAMQYHARWSYGGEALDLALQAGSVLDALGVPSLPAPGELVARDIDIPLYHPRYSLVGIAAAVPIDSLLLRGELAAEIDRPLAVRRRDTPFLEIRQERHTQLNGLLGVTYFIAGNTTAALELSQSYLAGSPARRTPQTHEPLWPVEATRVALRLDWRFLRERASLNLLGLLIGVVERNAWLARVELGYALTDTLRALLGFITYHPEDRFGPFHGFHRHDRVQLGLQWDFSIE